MTCTFTILFALGGLLAAGGCVTAEGAFKDDGLARAAFELECPAEELTVTVLEWRKPRPCPETLREAA